MEKPIEVVSSNKKSVEIFLKKIYIPSKNSRKGNNGRVLVIGGSELFHNAPLWATEIVSRFVDLVHLSSTNENNLLFRKLKAKFNHGIIVRRDNLESYINEDDVVLVGPGMMRDDNFKKSFIEPKPLIDIFKIKNEGLLTRELVYFLIVNYKYKKFVFDAGALQMMDPEWLLTLKEPAILTPHFNEFESLFGIKLETLSFNDQVEVVSQQAKKYNCVILCKSETDIVSVSGTTAVVSGGNQGLTKGGTGDILAGLVAGISSKSNSFESAILASYLIKTSADELFKQKGIWFNSQDVLNQIPAVMRGLVYNV